MTTENPLKGARTGRKEKSPIDPQECCDWANARLEGYPDKRQWIPTGDKDRPIELRRFAK